MKVFDGLHAFIWQDYRENNCNTYLIDGAKKLLIDPGHQHLFGHVQQGLAALKVKTGQIDMVAVTHGHPDHLEGVGYFEAPTLFAMNEEEQCFIRRLAGSYYRIPEPDLFLQEGTLQLGEMEFQVLVTPGHSPASICLYWPGKKALFTGDVVFSQGIGRTDLPGGSGSDLKESIKRIAALDVEYLLCGHGDIVQGREAVRKNFQVIQEMWFRHL